MKHLLSRRQLLVRGLRAAYAVCLLPLLDGSPRAAAARQPDLQSTGTPVPVRIGELVQESRADFAAGQVEGLDLPRAGAELGLVAGPDGGVYTSAPLATEFPVSHVGVHWLAEGGEIAFELRSSRDESRWSRWRRVLLEAGKDENLRTETFGALLGARGARYLQYRASFPGSPHPGRPVQLLRVTLTYLDAQPRGASSRGVLLYAPAASPHAQSALLYAQVSWDQRSASAVGSTVGSGAASAPLYGPADFRSQIVSREAWGADESLRFAADGSEIWPRAYVPAKKVVVHHTAGSNDYSDGAAEARAIYTYHAKTLGWGDIGYHLLIDSSGQVYEGRRGRDSDPEGAFDKLSAGPAREIASRDVVAGHATSFNYGTSSVALIGNFQEAPLPELMRERLVEALLFECHRHGVDPLGQSDYLLQNEFWRDELVDVPGHRDCTPTECPGDFVYERLAGIRQAVAARLTGADRPPVGPVMLEQGRNPWPGSLDFFWQGLPGAQFSTFLEGWFRQPGQDEIFELSGYAPGASLPAWSEWSRATSASFSVPPEAHGHYTLHVRTRTAPHVEGAAWARFSALLEPQVPVDNGDAALARAEGDWALSSEPRQYYGHDFAYTLPGDGERVFRWRLAAPRQGRYAVQACWTSLADFATAAPFRITVDGELLARVEVDQTRDPFTWRTLAELDLLRSQSCEVSLSNAADGTVVADAVRLLLR